MSGASTVDGAAVHQWACHDGANHQHLRRLRRRAR
ncbi:hypothetical protein ACGFWF_43980 [Streptomyces sp. NPDC048581]